MAVDPAERPETRRNIELLSSLKSVQRDGTNTMKCFGNILELGCDAMVVESHREQNAGSALEVSVVFPGQRSRANKVVKFHCVVRRVRDRNRMHYDLAIEHMNEIARQRLIEYLSAARPEGESGWR